MSLRFCFELEPVEEIVPWRSSDGSFSLHWFGLTSGRYWIATPLGDALRYTEEQQKLWNSPSPYVGYQVSRLFEDLQYALPSVFEDVPSNIAAVVEKQEWFTRIERWINDPEGSEGRWDLYSDAMEWFWKRSVDTFYLKNGPEFHFWRTGDSVFIGWASLAEGSELVWTTPQGQFKMNADEFKSAVYDFLERVLIEMQARVTEIQTNGWRRSDCGLDVSLLVKEQQQRTAHVEQMKARSPQTDWGAVENAMERLAQELS